jgi:hypothetical protein
MIALIIISSLLLGTSIFFAYRMWFLAGTLAEAQEYIEEMQTYEENLEVTNLYMYSKISESYEVMQKIDRLGAFEKDDEAGTTFQLLNEVITQLKEEFDGEAQEEK